MSGPNQDDNNDTYDKKTLFAAAAIFIGFCAVAFFLPNIMSAIGTSNPYLTGAVIGAFLILPFVGLWWRGRSKNRHRQG